MKKLEEKIIVAGIQKPEPAKTVEMKNETAEVKAPTLDEMQKIIALQQEQLNKLNQLFADRDRFMKTRDEIKRFNTIVSAAVKSGEIECPEHRLVFVEKGSYKENPAVVVSTPEILREFLEFIDEKIKNKLQQLDANIAATA